MKKVLLLSMTLATLLPAHAQTHPSSSKEVCLCKIVRATPQTPVFLYIGKAHTHDAADFAFITRVFKVVHRTQTIMVWDGAQWTSHPQDAQGYTRRQMCTLFQEQDEESVFATTIGVGDYKKLQYRWKHKDHGKVAIRNSRQHLELQTKDTYFVNTHASSASLYSEVWEHDHAEVGFLSLEDRASVPTTPPSRSLWDGPNALIVCIVGAGGILAARYTSQVQGKPKTSTQRRRSPAVQGP